MGRSKRAKRSGGVKSAGVMRRQIQGGKTESNSLPGANPAMFRTHFKPEL